MQLRTTGRKDSRTNAREDLVAKALNRYSDRAFREALSERDRAAMSALVAEFFAVALMKRNKVNNYALKNKFQNTNEMCYG